ncbi:uncharacterized protein LOC121590657 [Anopheles merus]|uniref:uncharacterized protein LOC121590657 n=1 Tax=Anopheles merus TaxID=30066 RepID=UPI001BE3E5B2|nr:uncharacterized protein LOC121590657 [Anopheles merus]
MKHYLVNPELLEEMVEKLPATRKLEWVRYSREYPCSTLEEFGRFMEDLVDEACEVTKYTPPKASQPKRVHHSNVHSQAEPTPANLEEPAAAKPTSTQEGANAVRPYQPPPCHNCGETDHKVRQCESFKRLPLSDRLAAVTRWKLCHNCLTNHGAKPCRSRYTCGIEGCRERHHRLLHRPTQLTTTQPAQFQMHRNELQTTLFRVVPVTLYNGDNRIDTHAFMDEGSSLTFVESSLAESLGLEGVPEPLELRWTASVKRKETTSRKISLEISGRGDERRYSIAAAHTVDELSLPTNHLNFKTLISSYHYLQGLPVKAYEDGVPRMLIGLANVDLMKPLDIRSGQPGEPIAVKTVLGWAIYGPHEENTDQRQAATCNVHNLVRQRCEEDAALNETLRRYFTLEETGVSTYSEFLPKPKDVVRANDLLERTTEKHDGRFTTGLLWKSDEVDFPDSLTMATKRLHSLEKKLDKDPAMKQTVHEQVHMYLEKGYAHKATAQELASADPKRVWYLPLNIVGHPRKPNKKRLVWDAAVKVKGVSLNTQLLKGTDLLVALPSVLCRFRQRKVAFGGDIEKMFHQIQIKKEDTHAQRFLFRFNPQEHPQTYLMDVATFGAACSPCSAQYIMHRNADEHAGQYPEAAAAIKKNTYMDDYFDSCDTVSEARQRLMQVKLIHSKAGFNLRNWLSNEDAVLESLSEEPREQQRVINFGQEEKYPRVLGLIWDPVTDAFKFSMKWHDELKPFATGERRPTKRMVLRIIMSLFDPLGLLAPVLILGRIVMQDLWRSGMDWDAEVQEQDYQKLPDWYWGSNVEKQPESVQQHVFSDASDQAYGCAAYFRFDTGSEIHCSLVMARSKVAPLKHQSIPRLELEAALLGARLARTVCESHDFKVSEKFLHTDSEVVLSWIRSPTRDFKQFVACRVGEIISLTEPENWRHVPTKENPADCLTKRCRDTTIETQAHSLSTTACIMAIRRFIGRRGPPAEIWSDNGTNFIGASNELKRQLANTHHSCADTFTNANTRWNFNPPSAPHMGGVWERIVRSVKEGMSALDDGRTINDETLLTTLAEVEFLINTRPLVYQPQVSDSEALTPTTFF